MRRTKIVATIGPASDSPAVLARVIASGVDVARLNASHSTVEELDARLARVRAVARTAGRAVAVMLDLPGPKLRLGNIRERQVIAGAALALTLDAGHDSETSAYCPECAVLASALSVGDVLVVGDGDVELEVTAVSHSSIETRALTSGALASRKGITARGVWLPVEPLTQADKEYVRWGLEAGVDMIAQSFVRDASDVDALRRLLNGASVPLIAKIEQPEAIGDLDAIVRQADAVMVARGDLGIASAPERVPVFQKRIVTAAREQGRPVIVATQMLESMLESPQPTRAEASDVANAVFDSVDAVMLSGETAVGAHPVEAVDTMARIVELAEEYCVQTPASPHIAPRAHAGDDVPWAVSASVAELAQRLDLAAIVTPTESGATARFVAAHRPDIPIVAVTPNESVARRLALVWGVMPVVAEPPSNLDDLIGRASRVAREAGYPAGSLVGITAGVAVNEAGSTNLIHVRRI